MSKIELINELESKGLLKQCIVNGLFPAKILLHRDIYYYVKARIDSGMRPKTVNEDAQENFRVCRRTVYNAVNGMG